MNALPKRDEVTSLRPEYGFELRLDPAFRVCDGARVEMHVFDFGSADYRSWNWSGVIDKKVSLSQEVIHRQIQRNLPGEPR